MSDFPASPYAGFKQKGSGRDHIPKDVQHTDCLLINSFISPQNILSKFALFRNHVNDLSFIF